MRKQADPYIVFVLGYDSLIKEKLVEGGYPMPCDTAYDECQRIAEEFENSKECGDLSMGKYDALRTFLGIETYL